MNLFKRKKKKKSKTKEVPKELYAPAKMYPGKNCVQVMSGRDYFIVPCNVYNDGTLEYEVPKYIQNTSAFKNKFKNEKRKRAIIGAPPGVLQIPFRKMAPTRISALLAPEFVRIQLYAVDPAHDVTFNPAINEMDNAEYLEVLNNFRTLLKGIATNEKINWKIELLKGMEEKKDLMDYIWPIMFIIQTVIFLAFFLWSGA